MKTTKTVSRRAGTIALLGAAALMTGPLFAPAVHAQQGGFGGGGFGGPGGGQGGGGFNRRPPFAFGTVTAVDSGAGTITISGRGGGPDQTIQTQGTTSIVTQTTAAVSDLKKGDTIEVQGVPTGITASSVTIGQSPFASLGGPGGGGPGGPPPGGGGGFGGPGAAAAPARATATGTVTSTSPLTISLSSTVSLTLKMDPNAKVTKYTTTTLSAVKVGDRIFGLGTANDDGTFAATTVAVNVDPGALGQGRGFGGGGFGGGGYGRGRRGGGGFGGPGGGGFGGPGGGGPGGPLPGGFGGPPNQ